MICLCVLQVVSGERVVRQSIVATQEASFKHWRPELSTALGKIEECAKAISDRRGYGSRGNRTAEVVG